MMHRARFVNNLPLQQHIGVFFQQDRASTHSTHEVMEWMDNEFGEQWIGSLYLA